MGSLGYMLNSHKLQYVCSSFSSKSWKIQMNLYKLPVTANRVMIVPKLKSRHRNLSFIYKSFFFLYLAYDYSRCSSIYLQAIRRSWWRRGWSSGRKWLLARSVSVTEYLGGFNYEQNERDKDGKSIGESLFVVLPLSTFVLHMNDDSLWASVAYIALYLNVLSSSLCCYIKKRKKKWPRIWGLGTLYYLILYSQVALFLIAF